MKSTIYEAMERPKPPISGFFIQQKLRRVSETKNKSNQVMSESLIQAPIFQESYFPRSIPKKSENFQTMIIQPKSVRAPVGTKKHTVEVYRKFKPKQKKGYFRTHESEVYLVNLNKLALLNSHRLKPQFDTVISTR